MENFGTTKEITCSRATAELARMVEEGKRRGGRNRALLGRYGQFGNELWRRG